MLFRKACWTLLTLVSNPTVTGFSLPTERYTTLQVSSLNADTSAIRITIDNPPINIVDAQFISDMHHLLGAINSSSTPPKVAVLSSKNSIYFLSHLSPHLVSMTNPIPAVNTTEVIITYLSILNSLSTLSTIFISEIDGRAIGAGNEVAINTDMRFGGPNARLGAQETTMNVPHVGGQQALARLIGPARAAQYIMAVETVEAPKAEQINWINEALPTTNALRRRVNNLAKRIASFPGGGLAATKRALHQMDAGPAIMAEDVKDSISLMATPEFSFAVDQFIKLSHNLSDGWFERQFPESAADIWLRGQTTTSAHRHS